MVFGMRQGHAQEKGHERQASQVHKAACARLSPLFGVWKRFPPPPFRHVSPTYRHGQNRFDFHSVKVLSDCHGADAGMNSQATALLAAAKATQSSMISRNPKTNA